MEAVVLRSSLEDDSLQSRVVELVYGFENVAEERDVVFVLLLKRVVMHIRHMKEMRNICCSDILQVIYHIFDGGIQIGLRKLNSWILWEPIWLTP